MANGQRGKTGKESASTAAISGDSTKPAGNMPPGAFVNSSKTTTATILPASRRTWTSAELEVLQSKIGLVAGALADFRTAGGIVVFKEVHYPLTNGKVWKALKINLLIENVDLIKYKAEDGITEFRLVAVEPLKDLVAESKH